MQKFHDLIKQTAVKAVNSTQPMQFTLAQVTQASPNLQIRLDIDAKLVIDKDQIVVAEHLTKHKRQVSISYDSNTTATITDSDTISSSMTPAGYVSHTHSITSLTLGDAHVSINNGYLTFEDDLQVGQIVMVAIFDGGQRFFIMDRAYIPS